MQEAKFYRKLDNRQVQCRLCHHFCLINKNKTGVCGVRKNINGRLYSLVYGYPVSMNLDPIEKKPLFHFFPGSTVYSLGTLGCNFACANCQNWSISQVKNMEKNAKLNFVSPEKIVASALDSNCLSIAYTYNEPTVFAEYALAIMKLAHRHNLKNIWVSNGYMDSGLLDVLIPYLDAINVDLKSINKEFYRHNCSAKLMPVLNNLKRLSREPTHLEITTLVIPSLTDEVEMLEEIAKFIAVELDSDIPWHISRFSPEISWKLKNLPATGDDIIYHAYDIGKSAGLKYVYIGNIPGDQKENTYCPGCGELAIRRLGYQVERLDNHGRCAYCDKSLDIIE